jgi:hypothetical protein
MTLTILFFKFSKQLSQMMHMISWGQAKNNDVINVTFGKTKTPNIWSMTLWNFSKGIFQSKRQKFPLV